MQNVTTLDRPVDLSGRTALVVGATAGIGAAVAELLAATGATILIIGRDPAKLQRSLDQISVMAPDRAHGYLADLADLGSIARGAAALAAAHPRIDIVVANASVQYAGKTRRFTEDGHEATLGINHIGNAALLLALEQPIRAAGGRVVIVASEAHRRARGLPINDLMGEKSFNGGRAYSRSKLANILFARQLAIRWPDVTVYSAHPGGVLTDMLRQTAAENLFYRMIIRLMRSQLLIPDQAAAGILRIAADPGLVEPNGSYFELGRPSPSSALAKDVELGHLLFDATLRILEERGARASIKPSP